jgi:surface antigen
LAGNVVVLAAVAVFVLHSPNSSVTTNSLVTQRQATAGAVNPLDQLSSTDIALTIARLNNLPEATAITNQADSQASELTMAPTSNNVIAKPQVVSTALKSRADIQSYTTVAGDTIPTVASKFGVTSDSIRWSNAISGDAVAANVVLTIPPVNGIVYTVKAGDTPDTLAAKFKANKDQIIAYNDAEINGLVAGTKIIVPNGVQAAPAVAPRIAASTNVTSYAFGGTSAIYGYNGYDFGYCTWYVANRISVPSNWGNANTWDNLAPLDGWTVSTTPRAGAIGQTDRGSEGHVAYIEAVSDDGTMIKYSDMNGLAGWGRVGNSDWVSAAKFPHFIYR